MANSLGTVLPGADVSKLVAGQLGGPGDEKPVARLGAGLVQLGNEIRAVRPGVLRFVPARNGSGRFWVEGRQRRYVPMQGNLVLGTIVGRTAEAYRVEIGCTQVATLSQTTGFEGATKKNRPNLGVGDTVFARVAVASKDLEPELACFDAATGDAAGFGEVCADWPAMVYRVSIPAARRLQQPECKLLDVLGRHFAFEVVVGANGRLAVHAASVRDIFRVGRVLQLYSEAESLDEASLGRMIAHLKSL